MPTLLKAGAASFYAVRSQPAEMEAFGLATGQIDLLKRRAKEKKVLGIFDCLAAGSRFLFQEAASRCYRIERTMSDIR
jgi:hypothetical protein